MSEFNTYEVSTLLGLSETSVTALAHAGHLPVANSPQHPLAKKRQKNVYVLSALEAYAGRTFTDAEIVAARLGGAALQRTRAEIYGKRQHRVGPHVKPISSLAIGTLGRSDAPAEAPAEKPAGWLLGIVEEPVKPVPYKWLTKAEARARYLDMIDKALDLAEIVWVEHIPEEQLKRALYMVATRFEGRDSFDTEVNIMRHVAFGLDV